jgi:cellulose synthase operon protein C
LRKYDKVERLQKVRDSFKKFLGKLFERKDSLNYNTLIWIAETYYGLGEGMGDSPDAAQYFEKAYSAYKRILEGDTLDEGRQLAVKIRQVNCKRRQGSFLEGDLKQEAFEDALKIAVEVIGKKPLLLRAQTEAAYTLQLWGGSGEFEKHMLSINGVKESNVWGWVGISRKLNGLLEGGDLSPADKTEYEHKYLQSRYNISLNRFQYGVSRDPDKTSGKRKAVLDNVLREVDDFATGFGVITGKEFRDEKTGELVDAKKQFDQLYLDAQLEMGRTGDEIVLIEWPKPNVAVKKIVINDKPDPAVKEKEKKKKEDESGSMLGMIFGLLFLVAALGGGGWFLFKTTQQEKNRRKLYATMGSGTASPTPRKQATSKRPSGKTKPRTSKTQPGKTQPGKASSGQTKPAATRQQKPTQARRPAPGKGQPPSGKKRPDKPAT